MNISSSAETILQEGKLSFHGVGARETSEYPAMSEPFLKDLVLVMYEADAACVEQIVAMNKGKASAVHVLPYFIGETAGDVDFHVCYDPYGSSCYPVNKACGGFYGRQPGIDYVLSDAFKIMETHRLRVATIDDLTRMGKAPPPDYLSLDTQGSELAILRGAEQTLRNRTLAVQTEAEFLPIYEKQPLFSKIFDHLVERGFYLCRFTRIGTLFPYRAPIGLRGKGFHAYADVLFLRDPENILSLGLSPEKTRLMLYKLAFISILLHQFEFSLLCLEKSRSISLDVGLEQSLRQLTYYKFLTAFDALTVQMRDRKPPVFSEKYTFEQSKARFDPNAPKVVSASANDSDPWKDASQELSKIEKLLATYGLNQQAKTLVEHRLLAI